MRPRSSSTGIAAWRRRRQPISAACSREANAKLLRDKQGVVEIQLLAVPAASWSEAVAKARYVLNLYSASLTLTDTHHRDLVSAVLADLTRLSGDET